MWLVILTYHQDLSGHLRANLVFLEKHLLDTSCFRINRKPIPHLPEYTTQALIQSNMYLLSTVLCQALGAQERTRKTRSLPSRGSQIRGKVHTWITTAEAGHLLPISFGKKLSGKGVFMTCIQMSEVRIQNADVTKVQKLSPPHCSHSAQGADEPPVFPASPVSTRATRDDWGGTMPQRSCSTLRGSA